jgi:hypothetical protein
MADALFPCPFLGETVHLTAERIEHIRSGHPEFRAMDMNATIETIRITLENPSIVVRSRKDTDGIIFGRWENTLYGGKYVVVTVITSRERNWIITAFISRYQPTGVVLWTLD